MAITITKPTVGGNEDTWGSTINTALDTIVDAVNGTTGTTAPNLSTLTINGTDVTATAAELNIMDGVTATTDELNKLDGFTGVVADLNYAKDLRATGVTSTEFDVLDGNKAATATTVVGADRVVFNDGGTMKQVSMSDIATYTSAQVSVPTVNNSTITFSAGSDISITDGSLTTNQSSNKTITIAHGDTSTLNGATSNSGSNYIQNITVDDNGHVTAISASDASSNISSTFTRGTTSISTNSFTVAAGMYMIQLYSISTNNGGNFPLPTTNLEFGMINHIMTSTNTANALGDCYAYDGTNWLKNNTGTNQTQLLLGNSTSGGQNMSSAWGFLTFTGAATLTSTSYLRFNIIKVA